MKMQQWHIEIFGASCEYFQPSTSKINRMEIKQCVLLMKQKQPTSRSLMFLVWNKALVMWTQLVWMDYFNRTQKAKRLKEIMQFSIWGETATKVMLLSVCVCLVQEAHPAYECTVTMKCKTKAVYLPGARCGNVWAGLFAPIPSAEEESTRFLGLLPVLVRRDFIRKSWAATRKPQKLMVTPLPPRLWSSSQAIKPHCVPMQQISFIL